MIAYGRNRSRRSIDEETNPAVLVVSLRLHRHFELRELTVLNARGVRPLPARPAQLLIFHLQDTARSDRLDYRTGKVVSTPPAGILGPQTLRASDAL
jgi:hypothetical protein